nr:helix-turn-helix domain-containing protein [Shinella sp. NM-101]
MSATAHNLVSALVGCSLAEVERSLILSTLRQHHFNRTRAAEVLGISVRCIRNKIRSYRAEATADSRDGDVFRPRRPQTST